MRDNKIIRYLNQNRKKIAKYTLIIFGILVMIQVLNQMFKSGIGSSSQQQNETRITYGSPSTAVVDSSGVSQETKEEQMEEIKKFVDFCNNKEIDKAYEMITDDCKNIFYPTVNDFTEKYYNTYFNTQKMVMLQSWMTEGDYSTYRVNYTEADVMSTGNISDSQIETYITVEEIDGVNKLNLNKFVYQDKIEKESDSDNVKIKINYVQKYIDYEVYDITIENYKDVPILLDSRRNSKSTYLLGDNDVKYTAYMNEVARNDLVVNAKQSKTIKIKFNKMYNPDRVITSIVFTDIVKDYNAYNNMQNKEEYTDCLNITVGI